MEHVRDKWLPHPAERETGQRYPKLRRGKIGVEMPDDVARDFHALPALAGERRNLAVAHFDDRELRRDEEAVEENQKEDGQDLEDRDFHRDPVREECFTGGRDQGWHLFFQLRLLRYPYNSLLS